MVESDKLSDLQNAAINNGIRSVKSNNNNTSKVYVKINEYIIYVYDNGVTSETEPSNQGKLATNMNRNNLIENNSEPEDIHYREKNLLKFYVCMNCKFATWTRNELYKFTAFFPLSFYSLHMNMQNNLLKKVLNNATVMLENIMEYIERFINMLFNFVNIYKYISLIDTSLLKSLWSLRLKINFIQTLQNFINKENDEYLIMLDDIHGSEAIVIRIILEIIYGIEKFLALNCSDPFFYYNNKQFADNSPNRETPTSEESDQFKSIDNFLDDITPLNLEVSDTERCHLKNIYFESILGKTIPNSISEEIGNAKWIRGTQFVYVKDVYKRLKYAYDPEVVFLYQQLVLKTIVQLICSKVLILAENGKNVPSTVVHKVKTIREQVLSKYPSLPVEFITLFKLLESKQEHSEEKKEFVDKLYTYISKDIEIGTLSAASNSTAINAVLNDDRERLPGVNSSLDDFMTKLTKVLDWHCFFQTYELFHVEYGRYYYTVAKKPNKIDCFLRGVLQDGNRFKPETSIVSNSMLQKYFGLQATVVHEPYGWRRLNSGPRGQCSPVRRFKDPVVDEGCEFVRGLYHYCHVAAGLLNAATGPEPAEARAALVYVTDRLVEAADCAVDEHWYHPIFRAACEVVPLMETHVASLLAGKRTDELRLRLLRTVATVLDECALETCRPPRYNFSLFNNIDFGWDMAVVRRQIESSLAALSSSSDECAGRAAHRARRFHSFRDLYGIVADALPVFQKYERVVAISWKGERSDVETVRKHLTSIVTNASYFYEFYGIVVKYLVAALFYEINFYVEYMKQIHREQNTGLLRDNCIKFAMDRESYITEETFPDNLDYVKNGFKNYLRMADLIYCSGVPRNAEILKKMENIKTQIENQFVDLSILVDFDYKEPNNLKVVKKKLSFNWHKNNDMVISLKAGFLYNNISDIRSVLHNVNVKFNLLTVFV